MTRRLNMHTTVVYSTKESVTRVTPIRYSGTICDDFDKEMLKMVKNLQALVMTYVVFRATNSGSSFKHDSSLQLQSLFKS